MTDEEMNMWQHIDLLRDRVEELETQVKDQLNAFTIAMKLIADGLEKNNERSQ